MITIFEEVIIYLNLMENKIVWKVKPGTIESIKIKEDGSGI